MKYFLGTELIDGVKEKRVLWFKVKTEPTIDLISIGIKAKDGREYYAISKDFNLKEAWNRYDEKPNMDYKPSFGGGSDGHYNPQFIRDYWIRDNVLKPIFLELCTKNNNEYVGFTFTYKLIKKLINKYGKTNKQIAEEIKDFWSEHSRIKFYCSYSEWATLARLYDIKFGKYEGYLKYCVNLNQELWNLADSFIGREITFIEKDEKRTYGVNKNRQEVLSQLKHVSSYPKQTNEHHALSQARFNYELYKFIQQI